MSAVTGSVPRSADPPERRARWRGRRFNSAYLFVAPSVILIAVFIAEPILQSGWMSLHDWTVGESVHKFVGLDNYTRLYHDSRFFNALRVTALYTVVVSLGQVLLGLALAARLRRTTWYSALLRTAYFFPFIASLVVVGVIWRFLLDPQVGLVDAWLGDLGVSPPDWLQSTSLALPAAIVVGIWKNVGFTMIILLAGLKGVPEHLYEAARLDGARGFQLTRYVTLPSIRPTILLAAIMLTINSLQVFDLVYVMTQGGPLNSTDTLVTMLYREGFQYFHLGYASAIAWVLFLIIVVASATQMRLLRYDDVD